MVYLAYVAQSPMPCHRLPMIQSRNSIPIFALALHDPARSIMHVHHCWVAADGVGLGAYRLDLALKIIPDRIIALDRGRPSIDRVDFGRPLVQRFVEA